MILGALFNNPKGNDNKYIPLILFFVKSPLDPTWNWLVSSTIQQSWQEYVKTNAITERYHLLHLKLFGGVWDKPTVKETLYRFKKIRKLPGWKKSIVGGQYSIEPCKTHFNIHIVLLIDRKYQPEVIEKYVKTIWKLKGELQPKNQNDVSLTAFDKNEQVKSFERSISLCLNKNFNDWEAPLLLEAGPLTPAFSSGGS